jgi:hypothetical protein
VRATAIDQRIGNGSIRCRVPTHSSFLQAQATSFIASPAINGGPSRRAKSPTRSKASSQMANRPGGGTSERRR